VDELQRDYRACKINDLCVRSESKIEVMCLVASSPLLSFAWMFHVMTKEVNSDIFDSTWRSTMLRAINDNPNLTIKDIERGVWIPTFKHCQKLLFQLQDMSITLCDLDEYLRVSDGGLEHELKALCHGLSMCAEKEYCDDWIGSTIARIVEYRKLQDYHAAASLFVKLRTSLNLTKGDFQDVERIASEVRL
jgi:hypothetical protein